MPAMAPVDRPPLDGVVAGEALGSGVDVIRAEVGAGAGGPRPVEGVKTAEDMTTAGLGVSVLDSVVGACEVTEIMLVIETVT